MISAKQFIALVEEKDLVPVAVIDSLRKQLEESPTPITAALVAKRLVDAGLLSRLLAQRLLDKAENLPERPVGPSGELGLLEEAEEEPTPGLRAKKGKPPAPVVPPEELEKSPPAKGAAPLVPMDEVEVDDGAPGKPRGVPPARSKPVAPVVPPEEIEEVPLASSTDTEEIGLMEDEEPKAKKTQKASPGQPAAKPQPQASGLVQPETRKFEGTPKKASPGAKPGPAAAGQTPAKPGKPAASKPASARPSSQRAVQRPPAATGPLLDESLSLEPIGPLTRAGDALGTDLALGTGEGAHALAPLPAKKGLMGLLGRKPRRPGVKENLWDSPLLLIGGGVLLVLMILGAVLAWSITRQSGDEMFDLAEKDYQAGSYTQAIFKYDQYLEKFPKHPSAGTARVNRGLARLRQATEGAVDWSKSLEVAKEVLEEIGPEPSFAAARPELAALLPAIAQGLAAQAKKDANAAALVAHAKEALALVDKYVPKAAQQASRLADVEASLAMTLRDIARGGELAKAVEAIKKSASEGKVAAAYQIRSALVKQYPAMADNATLNEAVAAVSRSERALLKMESKPVKATTAEVAGPILAAIVPVRRLNDQTMADAKGQVVGVLGEGAAYGLDAASGKVLWRRTIGFDASARSLPFAPTPIPPEGADLLLVDAARHELLRVEAATGRLRWRHALGERFDAHPVLAGNRVLVATRSGRLVLVDLESGDSPAYVQTPQELRVGPAVDAKQATAYQVGEHSNLYVIDLAKGTSSEVVYVGHEPGSVTVPPVLVSRFLFLPINDAAEESTIRVYSLLEPSQAQKKGSALSLLQTLRVKGHVDAAPLVSENRVLITTDRGEVHILEIRTAETKTPVAEVAQRRAAGEENMVRFPLLLGARLWIGDSQLTAYNFHASRGQLDPKWVANEESVSLQALATAGQAVIHVRRRKGTPGLVVSAVTMDEGRTVWETWFGAPPTTEPIVDSASGRITAVTSIGAVFQLNRDNVKERTVVDPPAASLPPASVQGAIDCAVPLEKGLLAMAATGSGAKTFHVFNPAAQKDLVQTYSLPDPLAGRLAVFREGILAPTSAGQVLLLDPRSGRSVMEPFQPRLQSGARFDWREPAISDEKEIVVSDGLKKLYRIGVKDQPRPHLAGLAEAAIPEPLASSVACLGKTAFVVAPGGTLRAFSLPDLGAGEKWPLGANCLWGPRRIGSRVMLATEDHLYCMDGAPKLLWKVALPAGPVAGPPLEHSGAYLVAAAGGLVWRVDAATGKELARIAVGQPLATGPVLFGEHLLVGAHDGTLYQIKRP